ncbi:DUF397 domain-containing protein [Actinosynnema sp. NPDC023587]|uniref:DUF397 domain-containing protein n=1 Tax=Actinosynnema sp. NPDC023587 TaxID=3154695 RepID=UPI0033DBE04F
MTHDTGWIKSSRSAATSDACVEVRFDEGAVRVRDSKNVCGPWFAFTPRAWKALLASVRP